MKENEKLQAIGGRRPSMSWIRIITHFSIKILNLIVCIYLHTTKVHLALQIKWKELCQFGQSLPCPDIEDTSRSWNLVEGICMKIWSDHEEKLLPNPTFSFSSKTSRTSRTTRGELDRNSKMRIESGETGFRDDGTGRQFGKVMLSFRFKRTYLLTSHH